MSTWVRRLNVTYPSPYNTAPEVTEGSAYVDVDKAAYVSAYRLYNSNGSGGPGSVPATPERWVVQAVIGADKYNLAGSYNTEEEAFHAIDGLLGGVELTGTYEE